MVTMIYPSSCRNDYADVLDVLSPHLKAIDSVVDLDKAHVKLMQEMSCLFAVRRQALLNSPLGDGAVALEEC